MGDKNMDLAVKMLQLFPTFHFCLQPIKTRMAVIPTSFFCQPYFCLTLLSAATWRAVDSWIMSFGYPYVLPEIRTMQRLRETTILRQDVVAANGTFLTGSGISSSTCQGTSGLNPLAQGDHVLDPQTRINNIRAARNCPDISDLTCGK